MFVKIAAKRILEGKIVYLTEFDKYYREYNLGKWIRKTVSRAIYLRKSGEQVFGRKLMESTVLRRLSSTGAVYTTENPQIVGESNYTFGVALSKIAVKVEEKLISTVQEKNIFMKIFCLLLMNLFQLSPYEVKYRSERSYFLRASIIAFFPKITGKIGDDVFELRHHKNNICSLMKNNVQIAKFKKEAKSEFEQNRYTIFYSDECDFEICFIFCIIMDIQWYKDDTEWSAVRYEKALIPFDKFPERANWMP